MSVKFTNPVSEQEFSCGSAISFKGTADSSITQIELWADDQWLLGKTSVNRGNWELTYSFNRIGSHSIRVKGLDKKGCVIDEDRIWLFIPTFTNSRQNLTPEFILKEMMWTSETLTGEITIEFQKLKCSRLLRNDKFTPKK